MNELSSETLLWTLQFDFYVIFMYYKYYSSFDFFPQPLKNIKTILSSWTVQKQVLPQNVEQNYCLTQQLHS